MESLTPSGFAKPNYSRNVNGSLHLEYRFRKRREQLLASQTRKGCEWTTGNHFSHSPYREGGEWSLPTFNSCQVELRKESEWNIGVLLADYPIWEEMEGHDTLSSCQVYDV